MVCDGVSMFVCKLEDAGLEDLSVWSLTELWGPSLDWAIMKLSLTTSLSVGGTTHYSLQAFDTYLHKVYI